MEELAPSWRDRSCRNCETPLTGPFCARCGQRWTGAELSLREWLGDGLAALSNLDLRIVRTVVDLTRGPGAMVRRWVGGQRVRYTGPFRYAFLTAALWFLAHAAFTDMDVVRRESGEVTAFLLQYGQTLNLVVIPLLAVAVHVAFLGTRTSYLAHLCLCLFVFGHLFLFRALLVTVGSLVGLPGTAGNAIDQVFFLLYVPWGFFTFHRDVPRPLLRGLRTFAALVGAIVASTLAISAVRAGLETWLPEDAAAAELEAPASDSDG